MSDDPRYYKPNTHIIRKYNISSGGGGGPSKGKYDSLKNAGGGGYNGGGQGPGREYTEKPWVDPAPPQYIVPINMVISEDGLTITGTLTKDLPGDPDLISITYTGPFISAWRVKTGSIHLSTDEGDYPTSIPIISATLTGLDFEVVLASAIDSNDHTIVGFDSEAISAKNQDGGMLYGWTAMDVIHVTPAPIVYPEWVIDNLYSHVYGGVNTISLRYQAPYTWAGGRPAELVGNNSLFTRFSLLVNGSPRTIVQATSVGATIFIGYAGAPPIPGQSVTLVYSGAGAEEVAGGNPAQIVDVTTSFVVGLNNNYLNKAPGFSRTQIPVFANPVPG